MATFFDRNIFVQEPETNLGLTPPDAWNIQKVMKNCLETGRVDALRDSGPLGQLWREVISKVARLKRDIGGYSL